MSSIPSCTALNTLVDDCSICLSALGPGELLLTLSCTHKYHLQCLVSNVKAQNNQCSLYQTTIETSLTQLLTGASSRVPHGHRSLHLPLNAANTSQYNNTASSANVSTIRHSL
jgi:hypothetical protein